MRNPSRTTSDEADREGKGRLCAILPTIIARAAVFLSLEGRRDRAEALDALSAAAAHEPGDLAGMPNAAEAQLLLDGMTREILAAA